MLCRSFEHQVDGNWETQDSFEDWSSGDSFIFVLKVLKYGKSRVVLESKEIVSTFPFASSFSRVGLRPTRVH